MGGPPKARRRQTHQFFWCRSEAHRTQPVVGESGAHSSPSGWDGIAIGPDLQSTLSSRRCLLDSPCEQHIRVYVAVLNWKGTLRISACVPSTPSWHDGKGFSFLLNCFLMNCARLVINPLVKDLRFSYVLIHLSNSQSTKLFILAQDACQWNPFAPESGIRPM